MRRAVGFTDADTFATALRTAIRSSGLGLERIRARLQDRGLAVTTATLSYWQSGRSRPGRRASRAIVAQLEDVLGLAPGALTGHLHPLPPPVTPPVPLTALVPTGSIPSWLRETDTRLQSMLTITSEHDTIAVGPDRAVASRWARQILRAEVTGADRHLLVCVKRDADDPVPLFEPLAHCRAGAVRQIDTGLVVREVVFDRVLDQDESIVVEYRLVYPAASSADMFFDIWCRTPVRELVIDIRFDPAALPALCELVHSRPGSADETVIADGVVAGGSVLIIRHPAPPGRYTMRWRPA